MANSGTTWEAMLGSEEFKTGFLCASLYLSVRLCTSLRVVAGPDGDRV